MSNLIDPAFAWMGTAPVEYKFYNGEVTLFYDDGPHEYFRMDLDGNKVIIPGVTTAVHIIDKSAALTQWASNMACMSIRNEVELYLLNNGCSWDQMSTFQLEKWLDNAKYAHRNYKDAAGETGHIAHAWIESFIKCAINKNYGGMMHMLTLLPEDERARNGCIAALDWMAKHQVSFIYTERKIYSRVHDFAGTMDGLAYVTACGDVNCCGEWLGHVRVAATFVDVLAVIDWKTSNALYPEYDYQTAAYLKALWEELGLDIRHRFIARLGKEDADFESRYLEEDRLEDDFEIFLGCLHLHRIIDKRKTIDKAHKDAVKAAKKVLKDAEIAAEKERKALRKLAIKEAREYAKSYYKLLRQSKVNSVIVAQAEADRWLAHELREIAVRYGVDTEEELDIAA